MILIFWRAASLMEQMILPHLDLLEQSSLRSFFDRFWLMGTVENSTYHLASHAGMGIGKLFIL